MALLILHYLNSARIWNVNISKDLAPKKVREVHLQSLYENDPNINLQVRMIVVPVRVQDVVEAFLDLFDYIDDALLPIMDYTEDTYIGRRQRRGNGIRRNPSSQRSWWNVYQCTLDNEPGTNNCAETSGHPPLQNEFDFSHPTLWAFIRRLTHFLTTPTSGCFRKTRKPTSMWCLLGNINRFANWRRICA